MKSFIAVSALVAVVMAQAPNVGSLPQCGQFCITSMLGKAGQFNCGATDIACLCKSQDFRNGIHDCTVESCPSADQASILSFGENICSGAGANGAASSGASSGAASGASSSTPVTSTAAVEGGAGGAGMVITYTNSAGMSEVTTVAGGAGGASQTASGDMTITYSSDGAEHTTTVMGGAGAAGGLITYTNSDGSVHTTEAGAAASNAMGSASMAATSASGAVASISSAASGAVASASSAAGGAASSAAGSAKPSGGSGAGARITAAPIAIVLAALAAF